MFLNLLYFLLFLIIITLTSILLLFFSSHYIWFNSPCLIEGTTITILSKTHLAALLIIAFVLLSTNSSSFLLFCSKEIFATMIYFSIFLHVIFFYIFLLVFIYTTFLK